MIESVPVKKKINDRDFFDRTMESETISRMPWLWPHQSFEFQ